MIRLGKSMFSYSQYFECTRSASHTYLICTYLQLLFCSICSTAHGRLSISFASSPATNLFYSSIRCTVLYCFCIQASFPFLVSHIFSSLCLTTLALISNPRSLRSVLPHHSHSGASCHISELIKLKHPFFRDWLWYRSCCKPISSQEI